MVIRLFSKKIAQNFQILAVSMYIGSKMTELRTEISIKRWTFRPLKVSTHHQGVQVQ